MLDLEDQVQYEPGHLSNPDRFYFDLRDTQLAAELQGKSFDGDSLLSRIRIAQPAPGMTRIVLEARPGASLSRPQVSLERDPYRLVIEVSKAGASPKGAVNLFPNAPETEKNKLAIVIPPPTQGRLAAAGARAETAHRRRRRSRWMGPGHRGAPRIAGERSGAWKSRNAWANCWKAAWDRK